MLSLDRLLIDPDPFRRRVLAVWAMADLMLDSLEHVFSERRDDRRRRAIDLLFTEDCVLIAPGTGLVGREALDDWAGRQLTRHPGLRFTPLGKISAHNGMACLKWVFGSDDGSVTGRGVDLALLEGDRIRALYRFPEELPPRAPLLGLAGPNRT